MELQPNEKSEARFLLLEGVHQNAVTTLENAGYTNIEYLTHALDEETLIEKIKGVRFIGIRSRTQLTKKVLDAVCRRFLPAKFVLVHRLFRQVRLSQ